MKEYIQEKFNIVLKRGSGAFGKYPTLFGFHKQSVRQEGQALLFVVITMTIALALGVGLSLETINSVSDVADSDTSQKALAAAEGAAERALSLDNVDLLVLADGITEDECENSGLSGTFDASTSECVIEFESADGIKVQASVNVEEYSLTNEDEGYSELNINANDVDQIFLDGGSTSDVTLCWNGSTEIYYKLFNEQGHAVNNILTCSNAGGNDGCFSDWIYEGATQTTSNTININGVATTFDNCHTVNIASSGISNPIGLRLRTLGGEITDGAILPSGGLPTQGFKISTVGKLVDSTEIERRITVYKSFSYSPTVFDFSFYSKTNLGQ